MKHIPTKFLLVLALLTVLLQLQSCGEQGQNNELVVSDDTNFEKTATTNIAEAQKIANETLAKAKSAQNDTLFLKGYFYQTLLDVNTGAKDKALKNSELALSYSDKVGDKLYKYKTYYLLGKYYVLQNEYAAALNYYLEARDYFERQNDKVNLSTVYNGLGILYFEMADFDNSISYFDKYYNIYKETGDARGLAVFYGNMGNVYMIKEDYIKAKDYQQKSLSTFTSLKDTVNIVSTIINLSNIESNLKNYASSLSMLNEALKLAEEIHNRRLKERILHNYALVYSEIGQYDKAKNYLNEQIALTKEISFPRGRLDGLLRLADIARTESRYKDYAEYIRGYYTLKDSVYGSEIKQRIEELKWTNEFEKSELEKNLLKSKYDVERDRGNYLTISIVLIVVISLLIIGVVWLSYSGNKKNLKISEFENERLQESILREQINTEKEKAENEILKLKSQQQEMELDLKNREMTSISVKLIAKNKLMTEITELLERNKKSKSDIETELKSILSQNQNQEKDWEQFREVFEKIHPNFFEKIKVQHPQLSTTDVRICAYIKIGMSLHEVSNLLNITMQSLHTSRYRIRKKLNLTTEQNLDDFVNAI